ncbi:MAG: hypothetical protein QOI63_1660, partial [Thermoplasmata archaeon]|nr:hypothetical protein [Thermoplasmata archaeon]
IALTATGVFSRCDVEMDSDSTGFAGQAYGRAGVADLTLTVAGTPIHLEALDFELEEMGVPASTAAYWACDAGEVRVGASTVAAACTLAGNVNGGNVQVLFHEVTGPTPAGAGRWSYQGSAVHIIVTGPVNANIYIGYVQTTLSGGAPGGPLYVPNGPCLTPLCN